MPSSVVTDTEVQLIRTPNVTDPYSAIGISIYALLQALCRGGVLRQKMDTMRDQSIRSYGLAMKPRMPYYRNSWFGKAFEYAVVEVFNGRRGGFWEIICNCIDQARVSLAGSAKITDFDVENAECARVSSETRDSREMLGKLGHFKCLRDARTRIDTVAREMSGLEHKVDLLFYEPEATMPRFGIMAQVKSSRRALLTETSKRAFREFPLDIAITMETKRIKRVRFEDSLGVYVAHLPMQLDEATNAWNTATEIVTEALEQGDRSRLLRKFLAWFKPGTPACYWVEFLAERLEIDIHYVIDEIENDVQSEHRELYVPTIGDVELDTSLDLTNLESA